MILVAGGTGTLGSRLVSLLAERGEQVRVLTRDPARAARVDARAEVAVGDTGDPEALGRAVAGARTVISAIHGFTGTPGATPASVDRDGNRNLIRAVLAAESAHIILVSVRGASPAHPMALMRMKHAAEQELIASGLDWTIIRPSAYMETWCEVLGRPLLAKGKTMVFGRGANPVNWVSAWDVARFADLAAADPALRGRVIEVGGPKNLTMTEFVRVFQRETGADGRTRHIPRALMRLTATVARPVNPALARQIQAALIMDTQPQAFDASATRRLYPSIPSTSLAAVVRRDFAGSPDVASRHPYPL
ncbi:MAG: SDR family oxidoreductase [Actinobacteria bacterium]|nr:SDR family oxidoreductase [Actinomycetota bacterium]MBO0785796.1 SDR family oxidoreductase [Actinomycetota bacterium]